MAVAEQVVLDEVDVEATALGTLFMHPALAVETVSMQPDWFSDPLARYMFEHVVAMRDKGHTPSPASIIAALPENCGALTRSQFFASVCASAVHPQAFGGIKATLRNRWQRRQLIIASDELRDAATRFETDPVEIADTVSAELDKLNFGAKDNTSRTLTQAAESLFHDLEHSESMRGAPTGLASLDKKLNGYKAGQLYVIAGRPGMGKSAFMVSSLRQTAEAGYGVGIFSLEMSAEEITARAVSDAMGELRAPQYGNILKGNLSAAEREALRATAERFDDLPLYIEDASRLTMRDIAARSRAFKKQLEEQGRFLSVICIDHMGLVTPTDRYRGNKVAEAAEVSGAARALAKELDCCVILLCQLSREVEKRDDKRPVMSDLRWSGEIEQDAHVVAFLYRDYYYASQDPNADLTMSPKNSLEFLIRKNRNGETCDVVLWCSIAHSSVRDE